MLQAELNAMPYIKPAAIAALLAAAVLAGPVSRRLGGSRLASFGSIAALGAVLALTLAPSTDAWTHRSRRASFSLTPNPLAHLGTLSVTTLNVLLFVPLALAVPFIARGRTRCGAAIGFVVVLPFAIEGLQWALPQLGRSGFELSTAMANLVGVLAGLSIAGLVGIVTGLAQPTEPSPGDDTLTRRPAQPSTAGH